MLSFRQRNPRRCYRCYRCCLGPLARRHLSLLVAVAPFLQVPLLRYCATHLLVEAPVFLLAIFVAVEHLAAARATKRTTRIILSVARHAVAAAQIIQRVWNRPALDPVADGHGHA